MVAVGNDPQFLSLCKALGLPALASDARFATNPLRVQHRTTLIPLLATVFLTRAVKDWYAVLDAAGVPSGPINGFAEVFADPQIVHREMLTTLPHAQIGALPQVANPVKFSSTPVQYHRAPPLLGEHTHEVLRELLQLDDARIAQLAQDKVI